MVNTTRTTTSKLNLFLLIALCLGYSSTLHAAQNDELDDQKENDIDNEEDNKVKDNQVFL